MIQEEVLSKNLTETIFNGKKKLKNCQSFIPSPNNKKLIITNFNEYCKFVKNKQLKLSLLFLIILSRHKSKEKMILPPMKTIKIVVI